MRTAPALVVAMFVPRYDFLGRLQTHHAVRVGNEHVLADVLTVHVSADNSDPPHFCVRSSLLGIHQLIEKVSLLPGASVIVVTVK
jgi:hypothetical protein